MPWELVRVEDRAARDDQPFISVSSGRVSFSAVFVRLAQLNTRHRVSIFVDEETFRIAFEFHQEDRSDSLALAEDNKGKTKKQSALFCSSVGLNKRCAWVRAVTKLPSRDRRFPPKKESGKWVIELAPSFELRNARESTNVPTDAVGIYRYLRESGEIVYIGRGNIRKRLNSPERTDWDFDVIEYSIVRDPDEQLRWEAYWIDKFKESNGGRLPFYNKVSGKDLGDEGSD